MLTLAVKRTEALRWSANQVDPIRIGGKNRKPAVSAENLQTEFVSRAAELIDWDATLAVAGFDRDEAEFLLMNTLERRTRTEIAKELKWSTRKAQAVQRRVLRKMAFGPVAPHEEPRMRSASGVVFKLHLSRPGHWVYDLTLPNPIEPFVIQLERTMFFSESST
jgi:hypothetical protein